MAANEEVTGERARTYTQSQLDEAVRKAVDAAIAREESEKTKEKEDTKSRTINNNYTCYGLCYNRVDLSETKNSKGKNFFSKDVLAEKNYFHQLRFHQFMKKVREMLRKIFNLRPPFPKA